MSEASDITRLRADVDKLLRSLYGENDGDAQFYRGFFREFASYRVETKDEFRSVRDDLRRLRLEIDEVSGTCEELHSESQARKRREEKLSRWIVPIVVTLIGTATTSLLGLLVLILQTYALQP